MKHHHKKFDFIVFLAIIAFCAGGMQTLPGTGYAQKVDGFFQSGDSKIPDLSGLGWFHDDLFVAVHDAKNPEEKSLQRVSMLKLPQDLKGIQCKPLSLKFPGGKSNDLESIARIPGTSDFFLVESGDDAGPFQRIFLVEFSSNWWARVVDVLEWPVAIKNVEGTAVATVGEHLIFVYAERAEGSNKTDLMFLDYEGARTAGTFINPDFPRTNRPITALDVDSEGWVYAASAFDPEDDNGPFRSVVWELGRITTNSTTDEPELELNPLQLAVLNGVKVESVAVREMDGSGLELFAGVDDENYQGTMRQLKLGPFGWAVGSSADGYGTIIHTRDGGKTWVRQGSPSTIPDASFYDVSAVDRKKAWVVGALPPDTGVILHTSDGGKTWVEQRTIPNAELFGVSAVNDKVAWAVGASGIILQTIDGGASWIRQGQDIDPSTAYFQNVSAVDENNVWAVGAGDSERSTNGVIFHTTDGGSHWIREGESSIDQSGLIDIHALTPSTAWAVGGQYGITLLTTDGGTTWIRRDLPDSGAFDINGVCAIDELKAWITHDKAIYHTSDGGLTWNHQPAIPPSNYHYGITAMDGKTVWVVGMNYSPPATIFGTVDGGAHWFSQVSPAQNNRGLSGISFAGDLK